MTLWKKAVALLLAAAMMVPLALAAPSTEAVSRMWRTLGPGRDRESGGYRLGGRLPRRDLQAGEDHHPGRVHQDDTGRDPFDSRLRDGRVDGGHRQKERRELRNDFV